MFPLHPLPRPEEGETHLPAVVEVGVEPHLAAARRPEVDLGGTLGILGRKVDIEQVTAPRVWRVLGPEREK